MIACGFSAAGSMVYLSSGKRLRPTGLISLKVLMVYDPAAKPRTAVNGAPRTAAPPTPDTRATRHTTLAACILIWVTIRALQSGR